ncbi:unnamed protein product [marine sediment metagenome]|uniref:Uncharacterized protein n=1 Tax=marine sediment metagenome TaxID=412755 RepID=X1KHJ6_9ZZZZ
MNYISIKNINLTDKIYYDSIKELISKENLLKILERAKNYNPSFLRIKDSIFNSISSNI